MDDARDGTELLASLGAVETRAAVLRERRRSGQVVPRGPRQQTRANPAGLTAREIQVLQCLVRGQSNREIAKTLVISDHTVRRHLQNIFNKIGVSSRAGATAFAGYGLALLQNSIWWRRAWGATLRSVFDALIYAALTAGTMGWLWPSA